MDPEDRHQALIEKSENLTLAAAGSSRRGGGGGGRGGRGGKVGAAPAGSVQNREVLISKALSKLLRHDAEKEGVAIDEEGYVAVHEVLQWPRIKSLKATFADIQTAVTDNAKQRFAMKPNPVIDPPPDLSDADPTHWLIRANQGHSIAIESAALLKPITLDANNIPPVVVHGTYYAFYPLILESGGLKKMTRNHIHFSTGLPEEKGGVISGMRNDAEILIYVDVKKSLEDGAMFWWMSENGVVLSEGDEKGLVPTKYWKKVEGRRQGVGVLWEDGAEVAPLPENVRGKKGPPGKGVNGKRNLEHGKRGGRGGRGGGGRGDRMKELDQLGGESSLGMGSES